MTSQVSRAGLLRELLPLTLISSFHADPCLDRWIRVKNTCPICQAVTEPQDVGPPSPRKRMQSASSSTIPGTDTPSGAGAPHAAFLRVRSSACISPAVRVGGHDLLPLGATTSLAYCAKVSLLHRSGLREALKFVSPRQPSIWQPKWLLKLIRKVLLGRSVAECHRWALMI